MLTAIQLREILDKSLDGEAWYGLSTYSLIKELSAKESAARPIPDGHTIWEIVLHMISWQDEVASRLEGNEPGFPAEGDWPPVKEVSEEGWSRAKGELLASGQRLGEGIERLRSELWQQNVGSERSRELGTGITYAEMVLGVLQHDAYHSGQIGLIRKLVSASAKSS